MKNVRDWVMKMAEAASGGQLFLKAYGTDSSAATVTAGAAGTIKQTIRFRLEDANGEVHRWFNHAGGIVTLTPAEAVTDADVGAPSLDDTTPDFIEGEALVVVTYDTDAGSTKTYAEADEISVTAGAMTVMGQTVDVSGGVYTDTMTA